MKKQLNSSLFSLLIIYSLIWTVTLLFNTGCNNQRVGNVSNQKFSDVRDTTEMARAIHDKVFPIDAHADIVTPTTSATFLSPDGHSKVAVFKLKTGGMGAVVMAIAVPPGPRTKKGDKAARHEANGQLKSILELTSNKSDSILLAKSVEDLKRAKSSEKIAIILGFQNARALQNDLAVIDSFYNQGVRMFALTHLGHNDFADSSRPFYNSEKGSYERAEEHGGLSEMGTSSIQRMNSLGAIVDVSQLSKAATLEAVRISQTPVIASHSNVRSISNVSRNLSDEEIDRIGEKGGVIHVSAFRAYLLDYSDEGLVEEIRKARISAGVSEEYSYPFELYWEIDDPQKKMAFLMAISEIIGPANVDHLVDHIDYIVDRIGIDHVGIGTDFNHGSGIDGYVDSADAFNITLGLFKRGYNQEEIEKIWSGNFIHVFQEVENFVSE